VEETVNLSMGKKLSALKQAVINDFSTAMSAYLKDLQMTKVGKGFFGSLRIIFPTITF